MTSKEKENFKWLYKRLERSLHRDKPICIGSQKWDNAYFTGYESALDKALEYMERAVPNFREIIGE